MMMYLYRYFHFQDNNKPPNQFLNKNVPTIIIFIAVSVDISYYGIVLHLDIARTIPNVFFNR